MDKQDTIEIEYQISHGEHGVDNDLRNPLNASLARFFSEQSDSNFKLSMLFFLRQEISV